MLDLNDSLFDLYENRSILNDQLITLIKSNRIIPFVGAGLSIDIYGSWGAALKRMMKGYFSGRKAAEDRGIETLIDAGDYEVAAQRIYDVLHDTPYLDRLIAMFKEDIITDERLKTMSVRYLPRIFNDSLVITTNFDKVLERVFLMEQYSFEEKLVLRHLTRWQADRVRRDSPHYLIKIHGCVSAPDEVVMTKTSYDELYDSASPHIERLRSILSGNNLLFIGCGLKEDRTVDLLHGVQAGGHYAILPMDGETGEDAFEQRRTFMANLHMHCIWYPKGEHHYVEDILEYIYADITDQLRKAEVAAPKASLVELNHLSTETKEPAQVPKSSTKPLVKNETYTIGKWEDMDLEWIVLDVQKDRALLITKECLLMAPYYERNERVTWEECSLRIRLLPVLLGRIFDSAERDRVLLWNNQNPDNVLFGTSGGTDTEDRLFLLSIDEAKQYFPYDEARVAQHNGKNWWWWLRSPGHDANHAAFVHDVGSIYIYGTYVNRNSGGVRPAFWLDLKS